MIIRNINLIDSTGKEIQNNIDILIENGKFKKIKNNLNVDKDNVIDGPNKYILPGMIDSHVHIIEEMGPISEKFARPFSYNFYKAIDHLKRVINAGVTTVRDALGADQGTKQAVEDGLILGPRMQISTNALTITGGHDDKMTKSGMLLPAFIEDYPGLPNGICDGIEGVWKKVREMLRTGADVVKVHATSGITSPTDHPNFTQFSVEELKVMIQETQFRGNRKVMVHAQGIQGIKNCIEAGIHSIEHDIFLDDEAIAGMKERGIFLVPTLLTPVPVIECVEELGMSKTSIVKSKEVIKAHFKSLRKVVETGVKIAMGTDAGMFKHGIDLRELELMAENGMTPMQSILAPTKVAAECLGYKDEIGTIEENKKADFIILNDNPLDNISILKDLNNIKIVGLGGNIVRNIIQVQKRSSSFYILEELLF